MPRSLEDVLHYFLPEAGEAPPRTPRRPRLAPAHHAIVAVPVGERDVVRAAFVWNLAVELSRAGAAATVLAPALREASSLWPDPGRGPLGSELVLTFADDVADLSRAALDVAQARAAESPTSAGIVLVRVPPEWLAKAADAGHLLERVLLFSSPDPRDLMDAYALAKRLLWSAPTAILGITIHGVRSIAEARRAFGRLAGATERHLFRSLVSYGLIVDDLHVYRSILNRHAVGLAHPQSPATRSLAEVADLLLRDVAQEDGARA